MESSVFELAKKFGCTAEELRFVLGQGAHNYEFGDEQLDGQVASELARCFPKQTAEFEQVKKK